MRERPKKVMCFDNYPEAKMSLGMVSYPVVVKPYESEEKSTWYEAEDYGKTAQVLYDAFEHSKNGWVAIESY